MGPRQPPYSQQFITTMEIRTYGVEGFMDWQCEIPVGRARAIVHFTGGTMTSYGVTPAEFSTGDPVKQRIIEGSKHFKNGRIKLLRQFGEADPVRPRISKAAPAAPAASASQPASSPAAPGEGEAPANADEAGVYGEQAETEADEEAPQEVEVSCLTDAQNYLRDNFGIPTSKSRSKEKAQAYARENGLVFVGL